MLLLLVLAGPAAPAQAPPFRPVVGPGTTFAYTLDLHGQHAPFELAVARATDTLKLTWRIRGLATGACLVAPAAWQRADRLYFAQPQPGTSVPLPHQTFLMLSKQAFADLRAQGRYTYDQTVYVRQSKAAAAALRLNGQPLDVLHVVAQEDLTELWILNNPDSPVICRILHNPLGVDLVLNAIR
ncbi:hypothetical protein AXW84_22250 [Hymenobacter sp. PAMC 26628]|nr:hypothetical protein AXW84_22250 [Hymenobacter sp. PAMC 26628]